MILPQRAPVKPRIVLADEDELPLEHQIQQYLDRSECGMIALLGPHGTGKTTALRHLAAVFSGVGQLVLLDAEDALADDLDRLSATNLVVYAASAPREGPDLGVYRLAP